MAVRWRHHAEHCAHHMRFPLLAPTLFWRCGHWGWQGETCCSGQSVTDGVWIPNRLCRTLKPALWAPADKHFPWKSLSRPWSSGWVCGQSRAKKTRRGPQQKGKYKHHEPVSALSILHKLTHLIFMMPNEITTTMKNIYSISKIKDWYCVG